MPLFNLGPKKEKKKHKRKHDEDKPDKHDKKDKKDKEGGHNKHKKHKKHKKRKSGGVPAQSPAPGRTPEKRRSADSLPAPKPSSPPNQPPPPYAPTPKPSRQLNEHRPGPKTPSKPKSDKAGSSTPKFPPTPKHQVKQKKKVPSDKKKSGKSAKKGPSHKGKPKSSKRKTKSKEVVATRRIHKSESNEPNFETLKDVLVPEEPFKSPTKKKKSPVVETPPYVATIPLPPKPEPAKPAERRSSPVQGVQNSPMNVPGTYDVNKGPSVTTSSTSGTSGTTGATSSTSGVTGATTTTTSANSDPTTTPIMTPQNTAPKEEFIKSPPEKPLRIPVGRIRVYNEDVEPQGGSSRRKKKTIPTPEVIHAGKTRLPPMIEHTQEASEEVPHVVVDSSKKRIREKYIEPTQNSENPVERRALDVNMNEVLRIATALMQNGTDVERRKSFDWLAEHRNTIQEERREAAFHLNMAIGDLPVARELALATLRVLVDHGYVTEKEFRDHFSVIEQARDYQHITVSQLSHMVSVYAAYYKKKSSD